MNMWKNTYLPIKKYYKNERKKKKTENDLGKKIWNFHTEKPDYMLKWPMIVKQNNMLS